MFNKNRLANYDHLQRDLLTQPRREGQTRMRADLLDPFPLNTSRRHRLQLFLVSKQQVKTDEPKRRCRYW